MGAVLPVCGRDDWEREEFRDDRRAGLTAVGGHPFPGGRGHYAGRWGQLLSWFHLLSTNSFRCVLLQAFVSLKVSLSLSGHRHGGGVHPG